MQIDLTQIFVALLSLVGLVLSGFVIPLQKKKLSVEDGKISQVQSDILWNLIDTGVKAAEMIYNSDEGKQKKAYVLAQLEQQGYPVDSSAIDAAIEAAVLDLHNAIGAKE